MSSFSLKLCRRTYSCGQPGECCGEPSEENGFLEVPSSFSAFKEWLRCSNQHYLRIDEGHLENGDLFTLLDVPEIDEASHDGNQDLYQLLCFQPLSSSPNAIAGRLCIDLYVE